jgi:hypothetical protein
MIDGNIAPEVLGNADHADELASMLRGRDRQAGLR